MIANHDMRHSGLRNHVVFFAYGVIVAEILQNGAEKFETDAVGIGIEFVAPQTFNCE